LPPVQPCSKMLGGVSGRHPAHAQTLCVHGVICSPSVLLAWLSVHTGLAGAWHSASLRPPWAGQGWALPFRAAAGGSGSGGTAQPLWSRTRRLPIRALVGRNGTACRSRSRARPATALKRRMQRPRATRRSFRGERRLKPCRCSAPPDTRHLQLPGFCSPKPAAETLPCP
jgi:hypothetical protein